MRQNAWTEPTANGFRGRYRDAGGKKRSAGFVQGKTKRAQIEALRLAQAELVKVEAGVWFDPSAGKTTLDQYFENVWWPNCGLEHNTQVSYRSMYQQHMKPRFGDVELRKLLPSHIQSWVKQLEQKGLAPSTVVKVFAAFQSILGGQKGSSALRDGYIDRNPAKGTRLPVVPERDVQIYEPDEVPLLMKAMDPWWAPLPYFMSETGMRWGEVVGVQVDDFTLGYTEVVVRRTIVETSRRWQEGVTQFRIKGYPKTKRPRRIPLSPETSKMIGMLIAGRKLGPGDRLFAMPQAIRHSKKGAPTKVLTTEPLRDEIWPGGVPVGKGTFKCVWRRAHAITGIKKLRVYDLRATNISWLLDGGAPIPVVMELAGHTKLTTTQKYTKAIGVQTAGIEALARAKGRSHG